MRRRLAISLATLGLVAACGGGATPTPAPTAVPTPAPTDIFVPSPEPSGPSATAAPAPGETAAAGKKLQGQEGRHHVGDRPEVRGHARRRSGRPTRTSTRRRCGSARSWSSPRSRGSRGDLAGRRTAPRPTPLPVQPIGNRSGAGRAAYPSRRDLARRRPAPSPPRRRRSARGVGVRPASPAGLVRAHGRELDFRTAGRRPVGGPGLRGDGPADADLPGRGALARLHGDVSRHPPRWPPPPRPTSSGRGAASGYNRRAVGLHRAAVAIVAAGGGGARRGRRPARRCPAWALHRPRGGGDRVRATRRRGRRQRPAGRGTARSGRSSPAAGNARSRPRPTRWSTRRVREPGRMR